MVIKILVKDQAIQLTIKLSSYDVIFLEDQTNEDFDRAKKSKSDDNLTNNQEPYHDEPVEEALSKPLIEPEFRRFTRDL